MIKRGLIVYDKYENIIIVDEDRSIFKVLGFGCEKNAPALVKNFWKENINKICYFINIKKNIKIPAYYSNIDHVKIKYFANNKRPIEEDSSQLETTIKMLRSRVQRLSKINEENKNLKNSLEESEKDRKEVFEKNLEQLFIIKSLEEENKKLKNNISGIKEILKEL